MLGGCHWVSAVADGNDSQMTHDNNSGWVDTMGAGGCGSYHYFFLKGLKALGYSQNTAVAFFNCVQYWNRCSTHPNCPIHILVWGEA
jgi:hypothetical protein